MRGNADKPTLDHLGLGAQTDHAGTFGGDEEVTAGTERRGATPDADRGGRN
jgi:hypothetical protein